MTANILFVLSCFRKRASPTYASSWTCWRLYHPYCPVSYQGWIRCYCFSFSASSLELEGQWASFLVHSKLEVGRIHQAFGPCCESFESINSSLPHHSIGLELHFPIVIAVAGLFWFDNVSLTFQIGDLTCVFTLLTTGHFDFWFDVGTSRPWSFLQSLSYLETVVLEVSFWVVVIASESSMIGSYHRLSGWHRRIWRAERFIRCVDLFGSVPTFFCWSYCTDGLWHCCFSQSYSVFVSYTSFLDVCAVFCSNFVFRVVVWVRSVEGTVQFLDVGYFVPRISLLLAWSCNVARCGYVWATCRVAIVCSHLCLNKHGIDVVLYQQCLACRVRILLHINRSIFYELAGISAVATHRSTRCGCDDHIAQLRVSFDGILIFIDPSVLPSSFSVEWTTCLRINIVVVEDSIIDWFNRRFLVIKSKIKAKWVSRWTILFHNALLSILFSYTFQFFQMYLWSFATAAVKQLSLYFAQIGSVWFKWLISSSNSTWDEEDKPPGSLLGEKGLVYFNKLPNERLCWQYRCILPFTCSIIAAKVCFRRCLPIANCDLIWSIFPCWGHQARSFNF